jgi:DNA-binding response OmpR family regulator
MRILIVEDSDAIRSMIGSLVSSRGYAVEAVATGAKGLELAFANVPDVVLLDLSLPGSFDGLEVCKRLRENPLTRGVAVIIITAMDNPDVKRRAHEAGATAFYTKPFSPTALLKEIESLRIRQNSSPHLT